MTQIVSPPVSGLTPGVTTAVPYPSSSASQLSFAKVLNSSPYTCDVTQGGTELGYLGAGLTDVFPVATTGQPLDFTPKAGTGTIPAGGDDTLYVTWSDTKPTGSYPTGINATTVAADITSAVIASITGTVGTLAQQLLLKTGTVVANPGASVVAIAVPAWCRKAVVIVTGLSGSDVQNVQLNGEISQAGSIDWTASGNGQGTVVLAGSLYGTVDTLVDLFVLLTGGPLPGSPSSFTYWVVAVESDDVVGNPVNGQNLQATDFEYCDGVADTFATATMTTGGAVALIPAPPAGFLTKITSLSVANTGAAVVRANLVTGGAAFAWSTLPVSTGTAFLNGPIVVAGAVTCNISAASTSVFFTAAYKLVPLLR